MRLIAIAALLMLSTPAFALSIDVTQAHGESANISDVSCGMAYAGIESQVTIKNKGEGGVLCWYYTSENSERIELTSNCIRKNDQPSYSFQLPMPAAGQKSVAVSMECYDFLENGNDSCRDDFDYEYARDNKASCANADGAGCLGRTLEAHDFNLSCEPVAFNVSTENGTLYLYNSQEEAARFNVTNMMKYPVTCDSGIGYIGPNQTIYSYMLVAAPASGTGNLTASLNIACTWQGGTSLSKPIAINASYRPSPCLDPAIFDARAAVTKARAALAAAERNITLAKRSGINTTAAKLNLSGSYNLTVQAESLLRNARILCELGNITSALESAALAKQKAGEAINATSSVIGTLFGKIREGINYLIPENQSNVTDNTTSANGNATGNATNKTAGNASGNGTTTADNRTGTTIAFRDQELAIIAGAAAAVTGLLVLAAGTRRVV